MPSMLLPVPPAFPGGDAGASFANAPQGKAAATMPMAQMAPQGMMVMTPQVNFKQFCSSMLGGTAAAQMPARSCNIDQSAASPLPPSPHAPFCRAQ